MSANRNLTLIINPISGTVSKRGADRYIERKLAEAGYAVRTVFTERAGHARELAAEAAARGDYGVLACGGDGTINEIASSLVGTDTAIGIVPMGSGNGLARHIGIPVDLHCSLKVIKEDNIVACDYGTANGVPFFCTFGVGFDAAVSDRFARQGQRGLVTYLKSTLNEYFHYKPDEYTIEVAGRVITQKAFLVVCCNASQYGNNAFIAPDASIRDGILDITIVRPGNALTRAMVGIDMLAGFIGSNALVETLGVSQALIHRSKPGPAHIDGDPVQMGADITVECHHAKLKVFATRHKSRFIPVVTPIALLFKGIGISIARRFDRD